MSGSDRQVIVILPFPIVISGMVTATEAMVSAWVTLQAPTSEFVGSIPQTIHHRIIPQDPCRWASFLALHRDKHDLAHRRVIVPRSPLFFGHVITRSCANAGTAATCYGKNVSCFRNVLLLERMVPAPAVLLRATQRDTVRVDQPLQL